VTPPPLRIERLVPTELQVPETMAALAQVRTRDADDGDWVGRLLAPLIRAAAHLTIGGAAKHDLVKGALYDILVGEAGDLKKVLDTLTPFGGALEWGTDALIRVLPIDEAIDAALDFVVRLAYRSLREAGVAL